MIRVRKLEKSSVTAWRTGAAATLPLATEAIVMVGINTVVKVDRL